MRSPLLFLCDKLSSRPMGDMAASLQGGNHATKPCYQAGTKTQTECQMSPAAWLCRRQDPHGGVVSEKTLVYRLSTFLRKEFTRSFNLRNTRAVPHPLSRSAMSGKRSTTAAIRIWSVPCPFDQGPSSVRQRDHGWPGQVGSMAGQISWLDGKRNPSSEARTIRYRHQAKTCSFLDL